MERTPVSLLERLRQPGEQQAWARFVELCSPLLGAWARRTGLSADEADDLVQEVFLVLVRKLPEFVYDPGKSFRAWLKTVLLNKYRERRRQKAPSGHAGDAWLEGLPAPQNDHFWEEEYRQHLAGRAVEVMRAEFQPTTWRAFWELVVAGRPGAEVAAELGLSVNAVYIARSRVLRRLRQELEGLLE